MIGTIEVIRERYGKIKLELDDIIDFIPLPDGCEISTRCQGRIKVLNRYNQTLSKQVRSQDMWGSLVMVTVYTKSIQTIIKAAYGYKHVQTSNQMNRTGNSFSREVFL